MRLTGPNPGQAQRENHKGPPSPLSRYFHGPGMGPSWEGPAEILPTGHSTPEMGHVPSALATGLWASLGETSS